MQSQKTLPSGHKLTINHVSLARAGVLRRLVAGECTRIHVQFSDGIIPALLSKDRPKILAALTGTEVNTLKNLICVFLASEEIEAAVMACMEKWMLDGEAIKAETFEADDRRGDLIPCAVEVLREAVLPFFASLLSLLPTQEG